MTTPQRGGAAAWRAAIPLGLVREPSAAEVQLALQQLEDSLKHGQAWSATFERFWEELNGGSRKPWPPSDGRLNWLWLTDLEAISSAVDLGSAFGEMAAEFAVRAHQTTYLGSTPHLDIVRRRFTDSNVHFLDERAELATQHDGQADCVLLTLSPGWDERLPRSLRYPGDVPAHARRLLRSDGWFALLSSNPLYLPIPRSLSSAKKRYVARRDAAALLHALHRADFREIRTYLIAPDVATPIEYVPMQRAAMLARLELSGAASTLARLLPSRVLAARYPAMLVLARR